MDERTDQRSPGWPPNGPVRESMIDKLNKQRPKPERKLELTPSGQEIAMRVMRKHRLAERLLQTIHQR